MEAGDAVLAHIANACSALRDALGGARREGPWLATGPVRPGVRPFFIDGVFVTGNAAGEAHPAIAEGIGMAMQSAAMLCRTLIARPRPDREAASDYEQRWRARAADPRQRAAGRFHGPAPDRRALEPHLRREIQAAAPGARVPGAVGPRAHRRRAARPARRLPAHAAPEHDRARDGLRRRVLRERRAVAPAAADGDGGPPPGAPQGPLPR